jgi:hypothetical protein
LYNKVIPNTKNPPGTAPKIRYLIPEELLNLFFLSKPTKTYEAKAIHSNKIKEQIKSAEFNKITAPI